MNILHAKFPMTETGMLFDRDTQYHLNNELKHLVDEINSVSEEKFLLICSPFDIDKVDGDFKFINIDAKEYSYNELVEIIDKAWRYDELK
jgi:hypothetical protein